MTPMLVSILIVALIGLIVAILTVHAHNSVGVAFRAEMDTLKSDVSRVVNDVQSKASKDVDNLTQGLMSHKAAIEQLMSHPILSMRMTPAAGEEPEPPHDSGAAAGDTANSTDNGPAGGELGQQAANNVVSLTPQDTQAAKPLPDPRG